MVCLAHLGESTIVLAVVPAEVQPEGIGCETGCDGMLVGVVGHLAHEQFRALIRQCLQSQV